MEQEPKGSLDNNNEPTHKGATMPPKRLADYHSTYTYGKLVKTDKTQNKEQ